MIVYISLNADKNNKVYHKQGCFYEKRMKPKYRLGIDKVRARRQHFRECKYCAGLQGEVNIRRQTLNRKENDIHKTTSYSALEFLEHEIKTSLDSSEIIEIKRK